MKTHSNERPCPCGSRQPLAACCGRYHAGEPAPTAEALMRSRYSAFVLKDSDYLARTWHPSTRPQSIDLDHTPQWTGLEIRAVEGGGAVDDSGTVEFVARYRTASGLGAQHETSRFRRENGHWLYVDGTIHPPASAPSGGRNAPCPCGSGLKFKRCCGR